MDIKPLLSSIELELQKQVSRLDQPRTKRIHEMLTYHMGWTGEGAGPEAAGKRIRPLIVLLTCAASSESPGEVWQTALPAAAAFELVHNFSLVHDDIQDNSPKRRGRDTTWVKWGAPMAINAGDTILLMNAAAMEFAHASFDHAYSFGVMHHSPVPARIVGEVFRVLPPGGKGTMIRTGRLGYSSAGYVVTAALAKTPQTIAIDFI